MVDTIWLATMPRKKKHANFLQKSLNAFREFLDGDENRKLVWVQLVNATVEEISDVRCVRTEPIFDLRRTKKFGISLTHECIRRYV